MAENSLCPSMFSVGRCAGKQCVADASRRFVPMDLLLK